MAVGGSMGGGSSVGGGGSMGGGSSEDVFSANGPLSPVTRGAAAASDDPYPVQSEEERCPADRVSEERCLTNPHCHCYTSLVGLMLWPQPLIALFHIVY